MREIWSGAVAVARQVVWICLPGALLAVCLPAVAQLSVSESGTPAYNLPISVPPGIAGMTWAMPRSFLSTAVVAAASADGVTICRVPGVPGPNALATRS